MAIRIGSNIASLQAQRRLAEGSSTLGNLSEQLASGLRINKASDDAAELSIVSALNANSRIFSQAIRNANDGISYLAVGQSAVQELVNLTDRQAELAEQSSNGVYSVSQRQALNKEAQALTQEYNRIINSAEFNGRALFTSPNGKLDLQVGSGANTGGRSIPSIANATDC